MTVLLYLLICLLPVFLGASFFFAVWNKSLLGPCTFRKGVLLAVAGVGTLLYIMRPEEQIESGEDAGAYLNAANWISQEGRFAVSDPALMDIEPSERRLFRYGDHSFLMTKDVALWARDRKTMDPVGVWFFPAYSVFLAFPMLLGIPYAAFWLSGMLAIATAVLLACLSKTITESGQAALAGFALFMLHPAIAWNARALRAEWGASFLVLAALILWLDHVTRRSRNHSVTGWIAGFSLSAAVLFHITAVYVLVPACFFSGLITRRDRFWLGWWSGVSTGILLLLAQLIWVTDPYWILPLFADPDRRTIPIIILAAGVLGAVALRFVLHKKPLPPSIWKWLGLAGWVGILLVVVYAIIFRDDLGTLPGLPGWTSSYLSLTDFTGVAGVISPAVLTVGLMGLGLMAYQSTAGRWILCWLTPAALTIGWMVNYMFETRRMLAFLTPWLVMGCVWALKEAARYVSKTEPILQNAVWGIGVLILAGVGVRGRVELYTTWNLKGSYRYYTDISERIQSEADFLFGEYTQSSVPIERFTGLPLLPVSWEYRTDKEVREAEEVFRRLVEEKPERRHVLISPFPGATIPGTVVEPWFESTYKTNVLNRSRGQVPRESSTRIRTLHVSRIHPSGADTGDQGPVVRQFQGSRLGLRGGSTVMRDRTLTFSGINIPEKTSLDLPKATAHSFWTLILLHPGGTPGEIVLEGAQEISRVPVGKVWTFLRLKVDRNGGPTIRTDSEVYLNSLFKEEADGSFGEVELPGTPEEVLLTGVHCQWLLDRAGISVSLPAGPARVWMLSGHFRPEEDEAPSVTILKNRHEAGVLIPTREWSWQSALMDRETRDNEPVWLRLRTSTPFDPDDRRYPDNLGLLARWLVVIPQSEGSSE